MLKYFSKELFLSLRYSPNQVVVDAITTAGTSTFVLYADGVYKAELIGGGGHGAECADGSTFNHLGSGGSGGGFVGPITLRAGSYTVTVGGSGNDSILKNSNNVALLTAGAGGDASATITKATAGAAGTLSVSPSAIVGANTVGSNESHNDGKGNKGNTAYKYMGQKISGADSIYNGYGKGGSSDWGLGRGGYFKLTFIRGL